ncbi:MAG: hypothetical protein QM802_22100 [Agriterribacter sp.]
MKCTIAIALLICCMQVHSQDSSSTKPIEVSDKYIHQVDKKIENLDDNLSKQTDKYINSLYKQEEKLHRKLAKLDSSKAAAIFGDAKKTYEQLSQKFNAVNGKFDKLTSGQYMAGLDSLQGSLAFLKDAKNILTKSKDLRDKLGKSLNQVNQLQNKLSQADDIKVYLQQRQEQIKQMLTSYTNLPKSISGCFGKYQQQVYYYSQTIAECKTLLNDPDKLISKVLSTLQSIPAFSKFFSKYSMLASLFPTPDNYGTPQALAGLQTRADVQQLLQQQLPVSATGGNPAGYLQQQMQQAQGELGKLKDKLNQLNNGGSGNSNDVTMPDNFSPNSQKTKSFWKRIELGSNFQTQRSTNYFPTTTEISLTAGYKLNDKSLIGVGLSGKMGWGQSWKHIKITGQGVGIRAFIDYKAPDLFKTSSKFMGSLWLTGGAEMNYTRTVESLAVFKNYSTWTKSALIGITKKYSLSSPLKKGKKLQGNVQFLYDFLHNLHIPPTQAFVWRVGYSF